MSALIWEEIPSWGSVHFELVESYHFEGGKGEI
jgi:hypothetical protein